MYRSKHELDMKIREILSKLNPDERLLRCIQFARLYTGLREYDSALKYLNEYVAVPDLPKRYQAYNMMGDIYQELNEQETALEHFKQSYSLLQSRDVLNKICSLFQNGYGICETAQSKTGWMDLQRTTSCLNSSELPLPSSKHVGSPISALTPVKSSPVVPTSTLFSPNFGSKSSLLKNSKSNVSVEPESMKQILLKKVIGCSATLDEHVALLQLYITDKEFREGSRHVHKHMLKFASNYKFLEKAAVIMEKATELLSSTEAAVGKGIWLTEAESYSAYFFVLENMVAILLLDKFEDDALGLLRNKRQAAASEWLFKLDQLLYRKGSSVKASPLECWWTTFLKHLRCQVAFYFGILGISRLDKIGGVSTYLPCFYLASSFAVDRPVSLIKLREPNLSQRIYIESCFRLLVCGRFLRDTSVRATATQDLKNKIYTQSLNVIQKPEYGQAGTTSEFLKSSCKEWSKPVSFAGFDDEKFWLYLNSAQFLYPECLDYQVWLQSLAIERLDGGDHHVFLHSVIYENLPFSASSSVRIHADSISQVDVDIFLTISSNLAWTSELFDRATLASFAPHFCKKLVTHAQSKWWTHSYRLTHECQKTSSFDWVISEYRNTIERGLEMIRNSSKTMPTYALNLVGDSLCRSAVLIEKTFSSRQFLHASITLNEMRVLYFDNSGKYFSMLLDESNSPSKFERFFECSNFPRLSNSESALANAHYVLGCRAMTNSDYDNALLHFNQISLFESNIYAAKIYKMLADEERSLSTNLDAQGRTKALLQKSVELLYAAVDRKEQRSRNEALGVTGMDEVIPVPMVQTEIHDEELHSLIDEVEKELGELVVVHSNRSMNNENLENVSDEDRSPTTNGELNSRIDDEFLIRTPLVKGRLSTRMDSSGVHASAIGEPSFIGSSTPIRSASSQNDHVPHDHDFSSYMGEAQFIDTLTEILQQNATIADYISQVSDEIKDLNDRFENLKKSKRTFVCKS